MIAQAQAVLAESPMLAELEGGEIAELVGLTTTWRAQEGEVLFRQGEPGDRLLVVTDGLLQASVRMPTGEVKRLGQIGPGSLVGELALLARGPRLATLTAVEPSEGVALSAAAFEFLRSETRPAALAAMRAIGDTGLRRLRTVYELLLDEAGARDHQLPALPAVELMEVDTPPDAYLRQLLFFQRFADGEATEVCRGLRVLAGPRGAPLPTDGTLWITLRGAVETTLASNGIRRRIRLAGPGRCVGHLNVLDDDEPEPPLRSVLRERAVLLELPGAAGRALMAGDLPFERRFAEALSEDVVRALLAAELPQAPVVRHAWAS